MLRNNITGKLQISELGTTTTSEKKTASIHLPPSPKVIDENKSFNQTEILNIQPLRRIQHANAMFDPNNASPASEFMNVLKLRMSVYEFRCLNLKGSVK